MLQLILESTPLENSRQKLPTIGAYDKKSKAERPLPVYPAGESVQ
jgi:hypothetical protein